MHLILFLALSLCAAAVAFAEDASASGSPFRPPSVPLVAHDPYFSIWSPADRLTDAETLHWTGKPHPLHSLARINGQTYRLMGKGPEAIPALDQTGLEVLPTRTIYTFANDAVQITLTFMTPALPKDLELLSRPVTYLTWEARSQNGKDHEVSVYFDASSLLAVDTLDQKVTWERKKAGELTLLRVGSAAQPVLARKGDDLRIDWGYLYLTPLAVETSQSAIYDRLKLIEAFQSGQDFPADAPAQPVAAGEAPVLATRFDLGKVGEKPVARTLLLAYDDLYSIEYFHQHLRPYWRRNGDDAPKLLEKAAHDYSSLVRRCHEFDDVLMADLRKAGGEKYARLGALAYRQALAASKLAADSKGGPLYFPKENFSNGCIATVDVIYPMAPQFLLTSPALMKATLVPVLDYAVSERWKWPFAPHDLGTYPKANGQVYGGGERTEENQMPVEESGNMLVLLAALAHIEGNARFAEKYWPELTKWAEYLKSKGLDPENQLCTDDFAGHLAHNVNLSAKAISGLRSYAMLCDMRGLKSEAEEYRKLASEYARTWEERANDGDHTRLAFDRPGTWSQKYNIVWDQILGFDLFPKAVRQKEVAFYRKTHNEFGLPLDSRRDYTKLDWTIWTATLGTPEDFEAILSPVIDFLNANPDRVPMTDWYDTKTAKKSGFQARSVVGGVFIKLLDDPALWKKWAGQGENVGDDAWAALPRPPVVRDVVPTSESQGVPWRYTTERPADTWFQTGFDDSGWKEGPGGFGTHGTPGAVVRTGWNTADIWLRREFTMPEGHFDRLQLRLHHDEDAEIYLNGVQVVSASGFIGEYDLIPMSPATQATLKQGRNVLAVHCHQTTGGQYIDVGIVSVEAPKP